MINAVGYSAKHSVSRLKRFEFQREDAEDEEVEIEVLFCGVCHSDIHQVKNEWSNTVYPCSPGHEAVGRVTRVGNAVTKHQVGDLVGVGCMIDSCRQCAPCLADDQNDCEGPNSWLATYNGPMVPKEKAPNGGNMYGTDNTFGSNLNVLVVREDFVLKIPDGLRPEVAAPILCADVTTYSPMKHWDVKSGSVVGVVGTGGLGRLAAKIAKAMGADVTVFTTTKEKLEEAQRLGVKGVMENDKDALNALKVTFDFMISTIPEKHDINPFIARLKCDATIVVCGALEAMAGVNNMEVAMHRKTVAGSLTPGARVTFEANGDAGCTLSGTKAWCSGARHVDAALLTVWRADGRGPFLACVDLAQPGVSFDDASWQAVGMRASSSVNVHFERVPARLVVGERFYLTRAGFWQGGIGIAACWHGGACAIADALRRNAAAAGDKAGWHRLMALGHLDRVLSANAALLREAARRIDVHPHDDAQAWALRTRAASDAAVRASVASRDARTGCDIAVPRRCVLAPGGRPARVRAPMPRRPRLGHAGRARRCERGDAMAAVMPLSEVALDERVADRTIHGQGTPERAWRGWNGLQAIAPLSIVQLAPHGSRVVVIAPHPDDEVLGCGGALAMLARAGHEILVVGVTDGEGSHRGSMAWTPTLLARQRRGERAAGLARLGVSSPAQTLGLPDGGIPQQEVSLAAHLGELLQPRDVVLTTWRLDGHPDHEAVGRATAAATSRLGCALWEVPVWMWHWAAPCDSRVPWQRMRRVALDPEARQRKSRAIAAHGSQLVGTPAERRLPVLPDWALARLLRPFEVFMAPKESSR